MRFNTNEHNFINLGVLLKYDVEKTVDFSPIKVNKRQDGKSTLVRQDAKFGRLTRNARDSEAVRTETSARGEEKGGEASELGRLSRRTLSPSALGVAFVGAGSYAQGNILPNLPKLANVARVAM